jgi:hypothetical protein
LQKIWNICFLKELKFFPKETTLFLREGALLPRKLGPFFKKKLLLTRELLLFHGEFVWDWHLIFCCPGSYF